MIMVIRSKSKFSKNYLYLQGASLISYNGTNAHFRFVKPKPFRPTKELKKIQKQIANKTKWYNENFENLLSFEKPKHLWPAYKLSDQMSVGLKDVSRHSDVNLAHFFTICHSIFRGLYLFAVMM